MSAKEQQQQEGEEPQVDHAAVKSHVRTIAGAKTVFLVRHAESTENVKTAALMSSMNDLMALRLPSFRKIKTAVKIINPTSTTTDSVVSENGKRQIADVAQQIKQEDFLREHQVDLVLHSPLKRARATCHGMFGVVDGHDGSLEGIAAAADDAVIDAGGKRNRNGEVPTRVLECLREKTLVEYMPGQLSRLEGRIEEFEDFLLNLPEERIVVVGHSQYFRKMLGMDWKFQNCDVWSTTLLPRQQQARTSRRSADINSSKSHLYLPVHKMEMPEGGDSVEVRGSGWVLHDRVFGTDLALSTRMQHFQTL